MISKYVCIYSVTGVRFVNPYVRGYVDNAYILTDTEALLNETRKTVITASLLSESLDTCILLQTLLQFVLLYLNARNK